MASIQYISPATSFVSIDGTPIGATTPATGAFTTASTTGAMTVGTSLIQGTESLLFTSVNLTSANILGMNASPVTVIAAVASKAILIEAIEFVMTRTATAYANGGAVSFQYAGGSAVAATIASTVVTGAAGTTYTLRTASDLSDIASAAIINTALTITNATAPFITGTGTAVINIIYRLI